ncbi:MULTISPECIES: DUF3575 domain-containing protein [Chryseobacterium]|uniref:DUF3575 domain-containing protein n=1 Tax=Chryseobacterium camelliae TaxID=1265445 RepID=A0ABU0TJ49_9FLAO|nr:MULTISPECIES: DUF3575 domain-containing protein [Chryseobacterium]MDT3409061.1 hypothetical protein [Pseudacidovorax intermedius]MDQ1097080.1 hypothetical protein [Chryseobacterium camelliae]MDQ1101018.1 hypothetical protein [Chryseobacterium sp. SORGH_AS_1048]MDR6084460.1 hypothetical protein [Chryseobacterium sp. SORGH_AS_0909]MDR6132731.1 hypothetical protein [Chryseobacterium sp. SORGH_AS_1175]
MKYTFITAVLTLLLSGQIQAQEQEPAKSLYIKGNALFIPIGVLNAGMEYQLSKKYTLQGDVFISPWKSFAGHEFQYYSVSMEGRYYFDEAFKHWYVGANIATSAFVLQKWNYWKSKTYINEITGEKFENSELYQKGYSVILGITAGYQFNLSERWNIDVYATAGTSQDFYKGYERSTGRRYDSAQRFNKSGEILPYRGGVMISYKLK